ncbi:hypothetical protein LOTGIDRAFT_230068 [Lottia gigantea]|uniref:Uncharacterized protein n=1 Tax=Lottia gigantea TaxID=225164 RepID=V4BGN6_LOTGI|nr:hypothetical protein LOTGIDRAFT_230068 [Lottia gigantea]ESP05032.1 hypothetical protein LOTGIDRAFT_230068 [Lottia gigantea]
MQNITICVVFLVLGSFLFLTAGAQEAQEPVKLVDIYDDLPAGIKTIIDKYDAEKGTINYETFLTELKKVDADYKMLKEKLKLTDELTKETLQTLFEEYKTRVQPAKPMVKLADIYDELPAGIKTIIDKYDAQTTDIDYQAFLGELKKDDADYKMLKEKLKIETISDLTEEKLKTLFEEYKTRVQPAKPMVKLADIYDELPAGIKTIIHKYKAQTTDIDYQAFLGELKKVDADYKMLKEKLKLTDELTKEKLQTLFEEYKKPENSSSRNGVTIVTVVMVSVVSMLVPYLK